MNGLPAMKNPDALRIFFPENFGGKYKPLVAISRAFASFWRYPYLDRLP
jgi:hypothetical protein